MIGVGAVEVRRQHGREMAPGIGGDRAYQLDADSYNSVELSACVLRSLREDATAALGKQVDSCVVTVPAYFNEEQRFAESHWFDAVSSSGATRSWAGTRFGNRLIDSRTRAVPVDADRAFVPGGLGRKQIVPMDPGQAPEGRKRDSQRRQPGRGAIEGAAPLGAMGPGVGHGATLAVRHANAKHSALFPRDLGGEIRGACRYSGP